MPFLLGSEEHTSELQSLRHLVCRFCLDRKSTRLNSSHLGISYAVFCLKKKIVVLIELVLPLHLDIVHLPPLMARPQLVAVAARDRVIFLFEKYRGAPRLLLSPRPAASQP